MPYLMGGFPTIDLSAHEPVAAQRSGLLRDDDYDHRWIEIRRPTQMRGTK